MPKKEQDFSEEQRERLAELSGFPGLLSDEQKKELEKLERLEVQNLKSYEYSDLLQIASDIKESITFINEEIKELQKNEDSLENNKNIKEKLRLSGEKERKLKVIIKELEKRPEYVIDKLNGLEISLQENQKQGIAVVPKNYKRAGSEGSNLPKKTTNRRQRGLRQKSESTIKGMFKN